MNGNLETIAREAIPVTFFEQALQDNWFANSPVNGDEDFLSTFETLQNIIKINVNFVFPQCYCEISNVLSVKHHTCYSTTMNNRQIF